MKHDENRYMRALNAILVLAAWVLVVAAIMYYPHADAADCDPFFNLGASYGESVSTTSSGAADYHPTVNGHLSAGFTCGAVRLSINHLSSLETRRDYGANYAAVEVNLWEFLR